MTDRERLLNELKKAKTNCLIKEGGGCLACTYRGQADCTLENLADYLLANGVIVPPCKVGDMVWYELYGEIESAVVYSCIGVLKKQGFEITDANAKSSDGLEVAFTGKCIGKTVFLTKEEAETKLKELGN